jgi:Family of unknown function (DUF6496)
MVAKKKSARRYGPSAKNKVGSAMNERKHGALHSGRSGHKATSRKQPITIGLSEARKRGAKAPKKRSRSRKK